MDEDFVTFKVDMKNAFKTSSSQQVCHPWSCYMGVLVLSSVVAPTWPDKLRVWSTAG